MFYVKLQLLWIVNHSKKNYGNLILKIIKKKRKYLELDFNLDFLSFVHAVQ